jgi:phage I-like protein
MTETAYTPEFGLPASGGPQHPRSRTESFFKTVPALFKRVVRRGCARILNSEAPGVISGRICNRALPAELPADGWFHLAPFGEFPGVRIKGSEKVPCLQALDHAALSSLESGFKRAAAAPDFRGLLLDYDHLSWAREGSSEAAGRIMDLQVRGDGSKPEDGAWVRIEFTPTGANKVRNKEYSYLSLSAEVRDLAPASDGTPRIQPVYLTDAALTNLPRLPVRAMNRAEAPLSPGIQPGEQKADEAGNQKEIVRMKNIALALGLAEDADEAAILAAIKGIKDSAAQLPQVQDSLKQLQAAQLRTEAGAFVETHKAHIQNRDAVVEQYVKNPEGTKALFGALAQKEVSTARALNGGRSPEGEGKETQKTGVARTAAAFDSKKE